MMKAWSTTLLLFAILLVCGGFTIALTCAPCFSSFCSEEFYARDTRIHIGTYYLLLASIAFALLLRAHNSKCWTISNYSLTKREVPVLGKRISIGGLTFSLWMILIILVTTVFWVAPLADFWTAKVEPYDWPNKEIPLVVTGIIAHHADIPLGLLLIPVGRNSLLGRAFALHQHTLLYAHKLIAYVTIVAAFAHGVAYYIFVGFLAAVPDDHLGKEAINIDNPALSIAETERRGHYYSAVLGTGTVSFLFMLVIAVTAIPVLRRRAYNAFYYIHVALSALIFIGTCIHASTNFYFLLPGLVLLVADWAWRFIQGDTGLAKVVDGALENAGNGWYRITLPPSVRVPSSTNDRTDNTNEATIELLAPAHPLQTYYLNIASISKIQNHAFTAAKVGTSKSGPVFLFQRASIPNKRKEQRKMKTEWTWKVGGQALAVQDVELPSKKTLEVRVEGPYIPSEYDYKTVNRIICIVGGTGITGALSIAEWFLAERSQDPKAHFALIWSVRNPETAQLAEWQDLVSRMKENVQFKIHVTSQSGRLNVDRALRAELTSVANQDDTGSAWTYVSGPAGLTGQQRMHVVASRLRYGSLGRRILSLASRCGRCRIT